MQSQHIHAPEAFFAPHRGHDDEISAMVDPDAQVFIDWRPSPLEAGKRLDVLSGLDPDTKGECRMASDRLPPIIPMLSYEDGATALEWLARAFGFQERNRMTDSAGRVSHAEMELGDGVIMLATPTPDYQSPKHHAQFCEAARKWSAVPFVIDGLHVLVDDVDKHFRRAQEAGAAILSEPEDQTYGERVYRVADLEGHRWMFAQTI